MVRLKNVCEQIITDPGIVVDHMSKNHDTHCKILFVLNLSEPSLINTLSDDFINFNIVIE